MSFARAAVLMSAGPLLWALHFAAIYGFTGIACARGAAGTVPWMIGAITLLAASACLLVLLFTLRRRERFEPWLGATLAGAALLAILWEALPALLVPACA